MKALYDRPNPYTGVRLADEPAVAIIQLQNEDSLLWWGFSSLQGDALTQMRRLFADSVATRAQLDAAETGLARANAAKATAVTLTGPVFGLAFGYLLVGSVPAAASLAGTVVVLTTLALLSRSGRRSRA
jgi:hypothetical protein